MPSDPIDAEVARAAPELLAFLEGLVNMDSPTEDKTATDQVGDVLQAKAEALGMTVARDPQTRFGDHRIARWRGGGPRVLMIGHFDTVYAMGTARDRPLRRVGDRLLGPGVLDMKGGLTVGLFALQALRAATGGLPLDVTFVFNSDEEIGSPSSRALIEAEAGRHDLALVLEPGRPGPAIVTRRKGVAIFDLEVTGREAHAGAEPEAGRNAIVQAAHMTLAIAALNDAAAGTTVTPGVISGGTKPYVVPGRARLSVDCRVPSLQEQERVSAGIHAAAARAWVADTGATLSGGFHRPPMEPGPATEALAARFCALGAEAGFALRTGSTGGASDGNLTAARGLPTLDGLGPHGARAHSDEEYAELPTLEAKCRVLARFLADLARNGLPHP